MPLYDSGTTPAGDPFYTMKLVRGRSLSAWLAADPPPLARLLSIFLDVAHAIAYAHVRGVVHRDLKPDNIMVGEFGEVLAMDWGLARILGQRDATASGGITGEAQRTQAGQVLGTPAYMAPEQARGETAQADARTDVYALGAILYRMAAGWAPIRAKTAEEAVAKAATGDIAPLPTDVPVEVAAIIRHAMAHDPAERYATAEALANDVRAFLEGRAVAAATYTPWGLLAKWARRNRRAVAGIAAAVLALVAGVGATVGIVRVRQERAKQATFDAAVGRARQALTDIPTSAELRAGRDPERPESSEQKSARESSLGGHLRAVAEFSRALAIREDPAAGEARVRAAQEIFEVALLGGDYTLARQVAVDLEAYGAPQSERDGRLARVEQERNVVLARRREHLQLAMEDIRLGLRRDGRQDGAPLLEDYIFEAAGYRDEQTVAILRDALAPLVEKAREQRRDAEWTQEEQDLAKFATTVLGRLDLTAAVEPLGEWMQVVWEDNLAVLCGLALCNSRRWQAQGPLLMARDRLGINSNVWRQIARHLPRLPDAAAEGGLTTADDFHARGLVRYERRQLESAISDFTRAIELDPGSAGAYGNRGTARLDHGDLEAAIADFTRAIQLEPWYAPYYLNRAIARRGRGDLDGAITDSTRAIQLDSGYAPAHNLRGMARSEQDNLLGALQDYTRAIELDPRYALAYNNRGNARRRKREFEGAISDFSDAIELDQRFAEAYVNRGNARYDSADLEGAISDYTRAIELEPRLAVAYGGRGIVRHNQGDTNRAIRDFTSSVELDPRYALGYYNRGVARADQGDLARATADLEQFLELVPEDPQAAAIRAEIERLRYRVDADDAGTVPVRGPLSPGQPVAATLAAGDPTLARGEFAHAYEFTGLAGRRVLLTLRSAAFDTYLILLAPGGFRRDNDDAPGGNFGTDSQLTLELPAEGAYTVVVTSIEGDQTGDYTLQLDEPEDDR